MGVFQLKSFVDNYGLIKPVDIKEKIREYRQRKNKKPEIVFDLHGLQFLWQPLDERLCGSRACQYRARARKFFQALVGEGAELVFVVEGSLIENKIATTIGRKNQSYGKFLDVLHVLKHYRLDTIVKNKKMVEKLRGDKVCLPLLHSVAKEFGKFITPINQECDLLVATYAVKNDVMAIVGGDTDYLIYEGNWYSWICNSINADNLTAMEYDRAGLRQLLNLHPKQMHLFALLVGNDIVPHASLNYFHRRISGFKKDHNITDVKFKAVANFVRKFPTILSDDNLLQIAYEVWGENSLKYLPKLMIGFDTYNTDTIVEEPSRDPLIQRLIDAEMHEAYRVLMNNVGFVCTHYDDMRVEQEDGVPTQSELILTVLKRYYGVILKNSERRQLTFKCFVKQSHAGTFEIIDSPITFPSDHLFVPELEKLFFENEITMDLTRWRLLHWILGETFDCAAILKIDQKYQPILLTLALMTKAWELQVEEADMILSSFQDVYNKKVSDSLSPPEYLDIRAVRITFAFILLTHIVTNTMIGLGLKPFKATEYFDGVWFHQLYQKWNEDVVKKAARVKKIGEMRKIYTSG